VRCLASSFLLLAVSSSIGQSTFSLLCSSVSFTTCQARCTASPATICEDDYRHRRWSHKIGMLKTSIKIARPRSFGSKPSTLTYYLQQPSQSMQNRTPEAPVITHLDCHRPTRDRATVRCSRCGNPNHVRHGDNGQRNGASMPWNISPGRKK
jgi:hypothetical protein